MSSNVEVKVKSKYGLRWGTFMCDDFIEQFPKQAATTTNINHLDTLRLNHSALGTEITEILLELDEITAQNINNKISDNRFHLLSAIIPANEQLTVAEARDIVLEQDKSKLKINRVFITPNLGIQQAKELLLLAARNKPAAPVFDMHLDISKLSELYPFCVSNGMKLAGFISRGFNTIEEALNMEFIRSRPDDFILRQVSWINARTRLQRDYIRSFVYYRFGFDVFGFQTKRGNQNVNVNRIFQLDSRELVYVPINRTGICNCVAHAGRDCVDVARVYERKRKSTVPSSAHTIRTINDVFVNIYTTLQRNENAIKHFETSEVHEAIGAVETLIQEGR